MESDLFTLGFNSFIWIFLFYKVKKKYKWSNIGMLYLIMYMILALSSVHLYYTTEPNLYPWNNQNIFALLYLLFFIFMFCKTLMNFDEKQRVLIQPPVRLMKPLYICTILLSLIGIDETISSFQEGFYKLMVDENYGQIIYQESTETFVHTARTTSTINILGVLGNISKGLVPLLLFYYLAQKKNNLFILTGLIIATFSTFMHAISIGVRSVLILNLLNSCMLFFYMKKYYSDKVLSAIKPILIVLSTIVLVGISAITYSRLINSDRNLFSFVESYASQGFLYFGSYGFNNGDEIREGDRIFPLPKSFLDKKSARSTFERREKYTKMKINESVFVTFVGDFVFDFGIVGAAIVMMCFIWLFKLFYRGTSNYIYFDQILIMYLNIYILSGFYLYPLSEFSGNLLLFSVIILALFFKKQRSYGTALQ